MSDDQEKLDALPWHGDLPDFIAALEAARGQGFWTSDWDLKYLTIRIDTRDNGYLLFSEKPDGTKVRIDPARVLSVIERHTARWGKSKPYAGMCADSRPATP